jgi:hypothetical protein
MLIRINILTLRGSEFGSFCDSDAAPHKSEANMLPVSTGPFRV